MDSGFHHEGSLSQNVILSQRRKDGKGSLIFEPTNPSITETAGFGKPITMKIRVCNAIDFMGVWCPGRVEIDQ
jgi:hypothetical protein